MDRHIESADGEIFRLRVADTQDAEAIVSLINVAFRKAEGFLLDRDRIDLPAVRELLQKGKFLVAEDKFLCSCVYLEQRGDRSYLGLLFSQSATAELWPQLPVDDRCRSLLREGGQPLHGFANG